MRGLTVALTVVTLILLGAGAGHAATLGEKATNLTGPRPIAKLFAGDR